MHEYRHFLHDTARLCHRLDALSGLYGHTAIGRLKKMAQSAAHRELVSELLRTHYDPAYERSAQRNFLQLGSAPNVPLSGMHDAALRETALQILRHCRAASIDDQLCQ